MLALGSRTTVNLVRHPLPSRLPSGHQPPAHAQRLSDEVSDNRHGQRRTSADTHGRSAAGHARCGAGNSCRNLASGRRGRRFNPATPTQVRGRFPILGDRLSLSCAPLVRQYAAPTTGSPCREHPAQGARTAASWHSPRGRGAPEPRTANPVLHQPARGCVPHDPRGNLRMPAASTAGYQIRSRKCSSVTAPPSKAVNTRVLRGRPAISTDMPSMAGGGTGTVRCDFLDFGHCRRPWRVITSTTVSLPRSQSTR